MKKLILVTLMISSLYALSDIIVHGEQTAGKGGKSVFGKSEDGDIFVIYDDKKISLAQCSKKYNFQLKNYKITDKYIIVDNRKILITNCINKNFLTNLSKVNIK